MPDLSDTLDVVGNLRYGMPTSRKEALAASGSLPGAPEDRTADLDAANRYASGYLFAQKYPRLAPAVQPYIDMVKTANFPVIDPLLEKLGLSPLGGSSPTLQSYATAGMNQALMQRPGEAPRAAQQADALRRR